MKLSDRGAEQSPSLSPSGLLAELPEFWLGLEQEIDGGQGSQKVRELIQQGSFDEDEGTRPLNHFHDPTKDWGSAGFYDFHGLAAGISSVWWQQIGGEADQWPKARETYFAALLETDPTERMRLFAETFKSLGHIIHLVQDVATPAHSRNDNHFFVDRFHVWAGKDPVRNAIPNIDGLPFQFTGDLVTATTDTVAPRPVARIIDATEEDRGQPAFTDNSVGLAEYSNSQFLSDDRTWLAYPYPRRAAMDLVSDSYAGAPSGSLTSSRKYFQFSAGVGEGETDYYVAADLPLNRAKTTPDKITVLDRRVLEDYGKKLLPRAIGYSVTAIEHFFRGRIGISAPDRGVYGRVEYAADNASKFYTLRFKVQNDSANAEETDGEGTLWAVVHYRTSSTNVFEDPENGELSAEPLYVVSNPVTMPLGLPRSPQEVRFDFPDGIPANSADVWLTAVYQGKLGGEPDAVLVGGIDLPEPQAIDLTNSTDYDCAQGTYSYVANWAADDPRRDVFDDHLVGPYLHSQQYLKVSNPSAPINATSSIYDFHIDESRIFGAEPPENGTAPVTRYVVLVDGDVLRFSQRGISTNEWGASSSYLRNSAGIPTRRNDFDRENSARRVPGVGTFRGWTYYHLVIWATPGVSECGVDGIRNSPPDLTRIQGTLAAEEQ